MRTSSALALVLLAATLTAAPVASFGADRKPGSIDTHPENTSVPEKPVSNQTWWPDELDLSPLRAHSAESSPLPADFNYAAAFKTLDLDAVKKDIAAVLTTPQPWWPADYGNYGPFFIRMAWHSAGTYRIVDGRGGSSGGEQRFEPLNSWPDNANLDKARRLLLPIKEKYGQKLSWGDLMVLTGNVALEQMGFKTIGFGGGRVDAWEPDLVYWGPETKFLADQKARHDNGILKKPLGASQMGLIYVNPQGPNGNPDPIAAASEIRQTFARMAMNDEETVALIAGGHTFGKAHGAHDASKCLGPEPAAAGAEAQGFGWKNKCGTGHGDDTVTSGLEGAWSGEPTKFTMNYLNNLFKFDWVKTKSPAGAIQWTPKKGEAEDIVPDAQDPSAHHPLMMFTTDLSIKFDPSYREIALRFQKNPQEFEDAFGKAWFKLTHRDMGPRARYLGNEVPAEVFVWQDPVPAATYGQINDADIAGLKSKLLSSGLTPAQLIKTAWASAASYRNTDRRGGANGARIRLAPEKDWAVNDPSDLASVLTKLEAVQDDFNKTSVTSKVSLADLIVLGGNAAIEQAAKNGGHDVTVPFTPGRTDASQDQTDVSSFAWLEPKADGFRNYYGPDNQASPPNMLVDRAAALGLTVPQMTVLVGGLRVLDANDGRSAYGVMTAHPGTLSNDFFVNLLDMSTEWKKSATTEGIYEGQDRATGQLKWQASSVDLVFGSNSELRAVSEFYASDDARDKFVKDFVDAWTKVMNNDRFDAVN